MSFFCLYRIVSISLYSAITSINLESKFFLDQTIPHQNHAISQKLPRSLSLKGLAELLPELPAATCSSPSPLQWSSLSLLRNGSCQSFATSVPTTHGHLLTCSHFLHFSAAVSTTSQPCFPSPTPIICMVLVLLLTAGLSFSVLRGLHLFWHTPPWRWPLGSASQLHLLTLYTFSSGLFHSQGLNTIHMSIIPLVHSCHGHLPDVFELLQTIMSEKNSVLPGN